MMTAMNILIWMVFGVIVGFIANLLDPNPLRGGLLGGLVLGVLGAILGGFLGDLLFGGIGLPGFNLSSFIVAAIGSLVLLFISHAFKGEKDVY